MTTIGEISKIFKGRKAPKVFTSPVEKSLPYLQIDDLRPGAQPKFAQDPNGVIANKNDAVIAWDGANSGTVGFGLSGYIGSTLAVLRFDENMVFGPFVGYFLQSKFDDIQANTTGATIPHVDRRYLESIPVSLPTLEEQKRIAAILDKADRLRRLRRYALELSDTFLQSVFLQMFGDPVTNPMWWPIVPLQELIELKRPITYGILKPGPTLLMGFLIFVWSTWTMVASQYLEFAGLQIR